MNFEGIGMTSKRTRDRLVQRLIDQNIRNQQVLDIVANTPRHIFIDEALAHRAYEDTALPIGHGQTISQPYIVARMTELLLESIPSPRRVLEVGTGSGYQTAVLAQVSEQVLSVERIRPLQEKARSRLQKMGLHNIRYRHADGGFGWPDEGVFDAILSAAAPRSVPQGLVDQLAPGGVLVIPVGGDTQFLTVVKRDNETGEVSTQTLEAVKFVPLLSGVTS